jgi:hypothetical protein
MPQILRSFGANLSSYIPPILPLIYLLLMLCRIGNPASFFRTANPKVHKINPLFCFRRQGSDCGWIESLHDHPDPKDHFLNGSCDQRWHNHVDVPGVNGGLLLGRPWKSYGKDLARPVPRMPGSSRYRPLGGAGVSIGRTITDFDLTFSLSI